MSHKVAYIEWIDASGSSSTMTVPEATSVRWDLRMRTAGLLLEENEERVIIAQDVFKALRMDADNCRQIEVIPRSYITKMRVFQGR